MTPELLYYPNFEPSLEFLKTHLLFSEKIYSIIPKGINPIFSVEAQKFFRDLPDTFDSISPIYEDNFHTKVNLKRMRFFFDEFSKQAKHTKDIKLTIDESQNANSILSSTVFPGYCPLYNEKISPEIDDLLDEYGLIDSNLTEIAQGLEGGNYVMVEENASNLIVSHIADKIGDRFGLSTITNNQTDYTVSTLSSLEAIKKVDATEGLLSSLIINTQIPSELLLMDNQEYKTIRNAYADIREPFRKLITDLNSIYRLDSTSDEEVLIEKIQVMAKEFVSASEKLKKTRFFRQIKKWSFWGIGSIGVLIAFATKNPTVEFSSSMMAIVASGIGLNFNYNESDNEKVQRLISGMQRDIIDASKVRSIYLI